MTIPTLEALRARVKSNVESLMQNGAAFLSGTPENVLSDALAGTAHALYQFANQRATTAIPPGSDEATQLRWAGFWGITPLAGTPAEATIEVSGTASSVLPASTEFSPAPGIVFRTSAEVSIPASPPLVIEANIVCVQTPSDLLYGTGEDGTLAADQTLSLVSPVTGIDSEAIVVESTQSGIDPETTASVVDRLYSRVQTPPAGGGPGDYVDWAREVAGVSRAWEVPLQMGPGTVVVYGVTDNVDEDGLFEETVVLGSGLLEDLQDALEAQAPLTALPYAATPDLIGLDPEINISPNDAPTIAAVNASLNSMLLARAEVGESIQISYIYAALADVSELDDFELVSPVVAPTVATGELLVLGTPVYDDV